MPNPMSIDSLSVNLETIAKQVEVIAEEVGNFIFNECNKVHEGDVETKSKNSLVTYVDKTAEQKIVTALLEILPDAGFIAEEGTSDKKGDVYNWIIDPLDGTTNFIHGIPTYSVSIALAKNKEIIIGIVYEPNRKECFTAWKNGGAYLNNKRIQVSATDKVADGLFATGFPYYDYDQLEPYMDILKWLMDNSRGIRRIGTAAIDLAYVACGRFEGFYEYSLNPWDVAAGALLVQEAGGSVTDFKGGNNYLFGKSIVATNQSLQEVLHSKIKSAF